MCVLSTYELLMHSYLVHCTHSYMHSHCLVSSTLNIYSCLHIRQAQTKLIRPFVIAFSVYVLNFGACSENMQQTTCLVSQFHHCLGIVQVTSSSVNLCLSLRQIKCSSAAWYKDHLSFMVLCLQKFF
jgi:hypothetical protein